MKSEMQEGIVTKMLNILLFSWLFVFASACGASSEEVNKQAKVERKYHLKDCIVKVDFLWEPAVAYSDREKIIKQIGEQIKRALVSGEFPLFSGHSVRDYPYYIFYYSDKCKQREAMTQKLIDEFFVSKVSGFPAYQMTSKNIRPGFDGVKPSGWWLDK